MESETNLPSVGQIITFYSYKGGTGRSMALANIACLLAQKWTNDEKILMIDWDLEAPGLHQFFRNRFQNSKDHNLPKQQSGLIDWFYALKVYITEHSLEDDDVDEKLFDSLDLEKYYLKTNIASLYLMPAGRSDDGLYSARVNSFNWDQLFGKFPSLMLKFAEYLRKRFRYVVIDSRTGYTDISGICTSLMPEKLVTVFTPNRQSVDGVLELIRKSTDYRKQSDDLRPLIVFPLASRIETAERDFQKDWRFGNPEINIVGYQPQFESVLKEIYKLPMCDLTKYFDDVQLQYIPRYSFGEDIAVLSERSEDRLTLAYSYENCTQRLVELEHPWEKNDDILPPIENVTELRNISSERDTNRQLRVFLCHASSDKPLARDLNKKMNEEGWIDPWLDEEKLLPGQDWDIEIERAVKSSDVIVVCLSKSSVSKEGYIQHELKRILDSALEMPEGSMFIVPLRLDDCQIPSRMRAWQYVDYFPDDRRDWAYSRLVNSLQAKANDIGVKMFAEEVDQKTKSDGTASLAGAYLLGIKGEHKGIEFKISHNSITIGRSQHSEIRLTDRSISRIHASVFLTKTGIYLRDEASVRGTYLNGRRVSSSKNLLLEEGDQIRIGLSQVYELRLK